MRVALLLVGLVVVGCGKKDVAPVAGVGVSGGGEESPIVSGSPKEDAKNGVPFHVNKDIELIVSPRISECQDATYTSYKTGLLVFIHITNKNPGRIVTVGSQSGVAKATDDLKNSYLELTTHDQFGNDTLIMYQTVPRKRTVRVHSDKKEMDAVYFEKPVESATTITITLDATKYEGVGTIRLVCPKVDLLPLPPPYQEYVTLHRDKPKPDEANEVSRILAFRAPNSEKGPKEPAVIWHLKADLIPGTINEGDTIKDIDGTVWVITKKYFGLLAGNYRLGVIKK